MKKKKRGDVEVAVCAIFIGDIGIPFRARAGHGQGKGPSTRKKGRQQGPITITYA